MLSIDELNLYTVFGKIAVTNLDNVLLMTFEVIILCCYMIAK